MNKPDLILQYCIFCDYPLFRAWLKKYRSKFNKVILYPSRQHGHIDLQSFAEEEIKETWIKNHIIDWSVLGVDWRQAEVEPCLEQIESDWIFFMEQDFFTKDWDKFFADIEKAAETADMIGLWNPTHFPYIHPSCLLIKKELLDKTNKDFRAHPEINGADHFSMITRDAEKLGAKIITLQDLGYNCEMTPEADAFHLGGLTYVYQDWADEGEHAFGVRSPEAFAVYNHWIRHIEGINTNFEFLQLVVKVEDVLKEKFPDLDLEDNPWVKYFKV